MTTNWVGWMLSVIVLLLLLLVGYILQSSVRLLITGKRAQGIVVGMDSLSRFTSEPGKVPLLTPLVEFFTRDGEHIRVSGRTYSPTPSAHVGDPVRVAYSGSNPRNVQLLVWKEFPLGPAGFVLCFAIIIILIWISGILVSGDSTLDDPFHFLPAVIARFRLNPFRFPVLFVLCFAIPACGLGTYLTSKRATDMRSKGIKVVGYVTGSKKETSTLSDGKMASGVFPMITFKDLSGVSHTIRRSLAKPLSRLMEGDIVEVVYLAGYPEQGVVNTWDEFWPPPIFFGFMMFAFIVLLRLVLKGIIWQ